MHIFIASQPFCLQGPPLSTKTLEELTFLAVSDLPDKDFLKLLFSLKIPETYFRAWHRKKNIYS